MVRAVSVFGGTLQYVVQRGRIGAAEVSEMRILFITPYVPSPIRVRPFNLIKGLAARGHAITLLTLAPGDEGKHIPALRPYCQQIESVPFSRSQALTGVCYALLTGVPLQAAYGRSRRMIALLSDLLGRESFDVVHVEHLRASILGETIRSLPKVYDSVDCISLLFERTIALNPQWSSRLLARLDLGRTRRYEGRLARKYERVLVTSSEDRAALQELAARYGRADEVKLVEVLPNGVDLNYFAPQNLPRQGQTIVFSGKMSYHANVASVLYLVHEIMPLVWRERPSVGLWVVGQSPTRAVQALVKDERVKVTGFVPDLRPYLAQAAVAVSPIRYGVGIQNKVLEAMAMGTPVVTSPRARLALQAEPGEDLLVADSPAAFAEQVLRLLGDDLLRQQIGTNGRRYVEKHHDWFAISADLARIYQETIDAYGRH